MVLECAPPNYILEENGRPKVYHGVHFKQFLRRGDLDVLDTRLPAPTDAAEPREEGSDGNGSYRESEDDETSIWETSTLYTSALDELEDDAPALDEANQATGQPDTGPNESKNSGRGGILSFLPLVSRYGRNVSINPKYR